MLSHSDNNFSDAQALTATADSTNKIDLLALGQGFNDLEVIVSSPVILDSAGDAATLDIILQTDALEAMASRTTIGSIAQIAEADLTAGILGRIPIPNTTERWLILNYAVGTENFTSGSITAKVGRKDVDNVPA
jgi:hypothetical protein